MFARPKQQHHHHSQITKMTEKVLSFYDFIIWEILFTTLVNTDTENINEMPCCYFLKHFRRLFGKKQTADMLIFKFYFSNDVNFLSIAVMRRKCWIKKYFFNAI